VKTKSSGKKAASRQRACNFPAMTLIKENHAQSVRGKFFVKLLNDFMDVRGFAKILGMFRIVYVYARVLAKLVHLFDQNSDLLLGQQTHLEIEVSPFFCLTHKAILADEHEDS
jgi:hypothetical protein